MPISSVTPLTHSASKDARVVQRHAQRGGAAGALRHPYGARASVGYNVQEHLYRFGEDGAPTGRVVGLSNPGTARRVLTEGIEADALGPCGRDADVRPGRGLRFRPHPLEIKIEQRTEFGERRFQGPHIPRVARGVRLDAHRLVLVPLEHSP